MTYIKAKCYTNLDDYDCSAIQLFIVPPKVGDYVAVLYKGKYAELRIVRIIHTIIKLYNTDTIEPKLLLELHN